MTPTDWMSDAACRSVHPEVMFAEATAHALATCRACPVRAECLEHALSLETSSSWHGLHGIWGGTTHTQRVQILRGREQVTA